MSSTASVSKLHLFLSFLSLNILSFFPDVLQDVETLLQYYLRVQAPVSEIPKQLHKLSVGVDNKTDKNSNASVRKILKLNVRCKFKNRLIHM